MAKPPKTYAPAARLYTRYVPGKGRVFAESQEELDKLVSPAPAEPAIAPGSKGAFGALARGTGSAIAGIGSAIKDVKGAEDVAQRMQTYGQGVVERNPARYPSISDIKNAGDVLGFGGEKILEMTPQVGATLAGGALAAAALPEIGIAGLLGAGATGAGITFGQQYGETREEQRSKGIDDKGRAAGTAAISAGLDIATGVGGRITKGFVKKGLEEAIREAAKKSLKKEVLKTAGEEAVTEVGQTALQRYGGYQPLTGAEATEQYATSALAGAMGGGAFGGALYAVGKKPKAPEAAPVTETGAPADMLDLQGGTTTQTAPVAKARNMQDRVREHLSLTPDVDVDETITTLQNQRRALSDAMKDAQAKGDMDTFYKLQDGLMQHNQQYFESSDPEVRAKRQELTDAVDTAQAAVAKAKQPKKAEARLAQANAVLKRFDRTENISPVQEYINARRKEEAKAADTQRDLLGGVGRLPRAGIPEGAQYDLFGAAPAAPAANITEAMGRTEDTREAAATSEGTPLLDTRPLATVAVDFSQRNVLRNLRGATPLQGAIKGYATTLSAKMVPLFQKQDLVGLQALLEKEENTKGQLATVDQYLPVINRALDMVSEFESRIENAKRQEINIRAREGQARAVPGTVPSGVPTMQDAVSIARGREQNAQAAANEQAQAQQAAEAEQAVVQRAQAQQAQAAQTAESSKRNQILTAILRNPDITNYYNAYEKQLKDLGMDTTVSEEELDTINRAKEAAERRSAGREVFKATSAMKIVAELEDAIAQINQTTPEPAKRLLAKRDATVDAITKALDLDEPGAETDALEAIEKLVGDKSYKQAEQAWQKMMAAEEEALSPSTEPEAVAAEEAGAEPASISTETQAAPRRERPVAKEKKEVRRSPKKNPPAPEPEPEIASAPEEEPKPKSRQRKYQGTSEEREAPKTSRRNRTKPVAEEVTKPAKRPPVPKDTKPKVPEAAAPKAETAKEKARKAVLAEAATANYDAKMAIFEKVRDETGPEALNAEQVQAIGRFMESPLVRPADIEAMRDDFKAKNKPPEPKARAEVTPAVKTMAEKLKAKREAEKAKMAGVAEKPKGFFQKRESAPAPSADRSPIPPRIYKLFRAEMDRMGLADVGLRIIRQMEGRELFGQDVNGHYDDLDRIITVVFQGDGKGFYTLSHEVVHALEDVGVIKPEEKAKVLEWAKSQPDLVTFINDNYPDLTDAEKDSEYVAQAYANWLEAKANTAPPTFVAKLFQKMADALDAVRRMVFRSGFKTADDVFKAIYRGDTAKRTRGESTLGKTAGGNLQVRAATQTAYEDARRLAAENVGGVGNRVAAATVIANKLIDMAVKAGIPSARKFERLLAEQGSVIARLDRAYENLSDRFDALKSATERGVGPGSINGFIQDMRFHKGTDGKPSRMWGFDPNYKAEDGSKIEVQINPELKAKFDALSPEAQQIVRDVFKTSRDNLYAKKKAVMDAFASEYDALIKDAKDRGDTKDVAKYERQKQREIAKYDRLMKIDPNLPYAPIKRFGDFVVVGRSQKYLEAEQEAERQKTPEAWDALRKLQEDGEHYYVDYAPDRLAAQRMRDQIAQNYAHPDMFRKDEANNTQMGGSSMFGAFQRMQKLIQEQGDTMDPTIRKRLNALATELYLQTLAASSSRKAEMTARLVHAGDLDMVRGAIAQGRSDARFIGTIKKNGEIADTLKAMSKEAKGNRTNSDKARELVQQISARHAANLAPMEQNTVVDKVLSFTTGMYLMTSPMFFVQQAIQNGVITMPVAAARHGYSRTIAALQKGYQTVGDAWGDSGVTQPLDIDRLQGVDRVLALFLSDRNALDVGIDKDMGNWTSGVNDPTSSVIQNVMKKVGGVTRKLEAINRLSSGKMMFELEMEKPTASNVDPEAYASYLEDFKEAYPDLTPLTEKQFAAANEAVRVIMDTHGDYSMAAAPTWMRGGFLRVVTQFKKFQIMQLTLYTQAINNAFFDKGVSPAEKEVARKTLLYMTGHAALFAGALGIPGAGAGEWLWEAINKLMGREGPFTAESDLRKAIGNDTLANLIINGAPTLAGIDLSGSLGQGNLLSVAPFAEVPTDEEKYKDFILRLLGPAIGGVGLDYAKGIGFMADGQYYKGLEKMLPKGVSNIVKAFRESSEGVSDKGGEITVAPEKISAGATLATALGVRTTDVSNRQYRQGRAIETKEYFQKQTARLKREYIAASSKKDGATLQELRKKWIKVQKQRAEAGLARQPMSDLIKAPRELAKREKNVIGGVKFTKATRGMAEQLAEETGEEE